MTPAHQAALDYQRGKPNRYDACPVGGTPEAREYYWAWLDAQFENKGHALAEASAYQKMSLRDNAVDRAWANRLAASSNQ